MCRITAHVLVGALGGEGPNRDYLKYYAISALLLGLENLAFTESPRLLNILALCTFLVVFTVVSTVLVGWLRGRGLAGGRVVAVTAVPVLGIITLSITWWSVFVGVLAFCARLIMCALVSTTSVDWIGGTGSAWGRYAGLTIVLIGGLVALALARRSFFLNILALYDFVHLCAVPSIWLVFELGGDGPNVDLYVGVTIAVMMGLVALAYALWSVYNILASCALLALSMLASAGVTQSLGLGAPLVDRHVFVVNVVVWGIRASVAPIQWVLDNVLIIGAVLVLSTTSSLVLVSAPGLLDAAVAHRLLCVSTLVLFGVFGASFVYQRYDVLGCILVLVVLLVPLAMSTWRRLLANRRLETAETKLENILEQVDAPTRHWSTKIALSVLAIYTGGWSKLVQIPYDIAVGNQRRLLKVEFERFKFMLADDYYCQGPNRAPGAVTPTNDLLLSKTEWKSAKMAILKKLKDTAERMQYETRGQTQFVRSFPEVFTDNDLETSIKVFEATYAQDLEIIPEKPFIDSWGEVITECLIDMACGY